MISVTWDLPNFITKAGSSGMSIIKVSEIAAAAWPEIIEVKGIAMLALEIAQILDFHCVGVVQRRDIAFIYDGSAGCFSAVSDSVLFLSVDAKVIV